MFWSDACDQGWGGTVVDHFMSGVWLEGEALLSINQQELPAVERDLRGLCCWLQGCVVAVFRNNTTAASYLRRQGGTLAPALNAVAQRILRWAEQENISLLPQCSGSEQCGSGRSLSPNQIVGSEWILHQVVFDWLRKRWPVTIELFASSLSHRCSVYFAPCRILWLRVQMPCSSPGIRYRHMLFLPLP